MSFRSKIFHSLRYIMDGDDVLPVSSPIISDSSQDPTNPNSNIQQQEKEKQQEQNDQSKITTKRKRKPPAHPDPSYEVVSLSPRSLMGQSKFPCDVCHRSFTRDQNLQLHRRSHNLPWRLRQQPQPSTATPRKKVFACPEASCVNHDPSRALGDRSGIRKHFQRKHGEKVFGCDKCEKRYAVRADYVAHSKKCGDRPYVCRCGITFARKGGFRSHKAYCQAAKQEAAAKLAASSSVTATAAAAAITIATTATAATTTVGGLKSTAGRCLMPALFSDAKFNNLDYSILKPGNTLMCQNIVAPIGATKVVAAGSSLDSVIVLDGCDGLMMDSSEGFNELLFHVKPHDESLQQLSMMDNRHRGGLPVPMGGGGNEGERIVS